MADPYHPPNSPGSSTQKDSLTPRGTNGTTVIVVLVVVLLILHQDNWFWTDNRLVFGFLPVGLFWHACLSVGAALTWWLATRIAWPFAEEPPAGSDQSGGGE